jgi:hypothetical protein
MTVTMKAARIITVYLVRKKALVGEPRYYCVDWTGKFTTTDNIKRALRWLTKEGAESMASSLGWRWEVVVQEFDGTEPAFVSRRVVN